MKDSAPRSNENKEKEYNTIQQILHTNKFNKHHLNNVISKLQTKSHTQQTDEIQDAQTPFKWATFTYTSKQTKHITKLFKNTNLKIADKTNTTLECLLTQQHDKHHKTNQNKFQKSGVYQLICKDRNKKYN